MHVATSSSSTEALRLVEIPSRPLGPRDVRVRVRSIGVNPVDWKMREGGPLRLAWRVLGPPGPLVTGADFAGEVCEVGSKASALATGTRVVGGTDFSRGQLGSYADEVVVREDQCVALPDSISFDVAACLPIPGATAWRALVELGGLTREKPSRVLVLGASGGVGLTTLQLARSLGAETFGVCSTRNADVVARAGATALDYTKGDVLADARAVGPFDVIVNAVGSDRYPSGRCLKLLKRGGRLGLVVVGPADMLRLVFSWRTRQVFGRPTQARLLPLVAALARGDLAPLIEARLPLADAEEAHVRSRAGKVVGKLLLVP